MNTRRYQPVAERGQSNLLPACLDDYVSEHNAVRAIDAWVATLDLQALGFEHAESAIGAGQPAYDPAILLKLYLYGYQCGIRSSRRLAHATRDSLEVIWLCQQASPSYRTIAQFRKSNVKALKAAQREFLELCRELSLLGGERVAVDGSFFKADASCSSMHTAESLKRDLKRLDRRIEAYHRQLDEADDAEHGEGVGLEDAQLAAKLDRLREKRSECARLEQEMRDRGERQISTVDADARLLSKRGRTVGGYNVQVAVDAEHKLIVAQEVVQDGNDLQQLAPMMEAARESMQCGELTGLADSGYCSGEQIRRCEEQSMTVYVAVPKQAGRDGREGRFGSREFRYEAQEDVYVCPAGEKLSRSAGGLSKGGGKVYLTYRSDSATCGGCAMSGRCLPKSAGYRRIQRWEHEDVMDRHRQRMAEHPDMMRERSALVEHPFGTLKRWAGMDHFLMRGLDKCRGEFALMSLGYNFKRVLGILGVEALMSYCAQNPSMAVNLG